MNQRALNSPTANTIPQSPNPSRQTSDQESSRLEPIHQQDPLISLIKEVVKTELLERELKQLTASTCNDERTHGSNILQGQNPPVSTNSDSHQSMTQTCRESTIAEELRTSNLHQDQLCKALKLNKNDRSESESHLKQPGKALSTSENVPSPRTERGLAGPELQEDARYRKQKWKIIALEDNYSFLQASHETLKVNFNNSIVSMKKRLSELGESITHLSHRLTNLHCPSFDNTTLVSSKANGADTIQQTTLLKPKVATEEDIQKIRSELEGFSSKIESVNAQLRRSDVTLRSLSSLKDDYEKLATSVQSITEFRSMVESRLQESKSLFDNFAGPINDMVASCERKIERFDNDITDLHKCVNATQESEKSASAQAKEARESLNIVIRKQTEQIGALHSQLDVWTSVVNRNDHSIRSLDSRYNALNTNQMFKGIVALLEARKPVISHIESELTAVRRQTDALSSTQQDLSEKTDRHTTRLQQMESLKQGLESAVVDISNLKCSSEAVSSDVLQLHDMKAVLQGLQQDIRMLNEKCNISSETQITSEAIDELQTKTHSMEEWLKESSEQYHAHNRKTSDLDEITADVSRRYQKAMKNGDFLKRSIELLESKFSSAKAELDKRLDNLELCHGGEAENTSRPPECRLDSISDATESGFNKSQRSGDDTSSTMPSDQIVEKRGDGIPTRTLRVRNLGPATNVEYVENVIFVGYNVRCLSISKERDCSSSALVRTNDPEEAEAATQHLSGKTYDGRLLSVKLETPVVNVPKVGQRPKGSLSKTCVRNSQPVNDDDDVVVDLTNDDGVEGNESLSIEQQSDDKQRDKTEQNEISHRAPCTGDSEVASSSPDDSIHSSSTNKRKRQRTRRRGTTSIDQPRARKQVKRSK